MRFVMSCHTPCCVVSCVAARAVLHDLRWPTDERPPLSVSFVSTEVVEQAHRAAPKLRQPSSAADRDEEEQDTPTDGTRTRQIAEHDTQTHTHLHAAHAPNTTNSASDSINGKNAKPDPKKR